MTMLIVRVLIYYLTYNISFIKIFLLGQWDYSSTLVEDLCYKTDEIARDFGLVLKHVAFNISIYELCISTHPKYKKKFFQWIHFK